MNFIFPKIYSVCFWMKLVFIVFFSLNKYKKKKNHFNFIFSQKRFELCVCWKTKIEFFIFIIQICVFSSQVKLSPQRIGEGSDDLVSWNGVGLSIFTLLAISGGALSVCGQELDWVHWSFYNAPWFDHVSFVYPLSWTKAWPPLEIVTGRPQKSMRPKSTEFATKDLWV